MSCSLDKGRVKICILTSVHPPFDDRIFHKEAKTLVKGGYNVVLIAQHSREETVDGVRIVPLPEAKNRFERMTKVVWRLFRLALREKANVYHFHDPELIPVGLILKFFGKKVIYDVHEDVPKQILDKDWVGNVYIRRFVAFITNIIEQLGASLFNSMVAATPDIAKKFNPTKTILLRNMPILELIDKVKSANWKRDNPIIIYAGGLGRVRGIKEIIQAMEFVGDKAELWLLGEWSSEEYKKECENLGGWKYTNYLGYIPYGKHYSFIKIANIGLINFLPLPNQERAMPNKPFEYMTCSLPMVMSNFPYWQEIFGECALFVNPYDPEDIAEKVLYLLDNPDEAKQLGKKGRQLVKEEHNWEAESKKLVALYKKLLK
ncbi:MAG: glycosyltransferase family 4 protein [Desulfobacteraceae bacterium]|nr:glycosyltransferase family 4 protein [Desulfobacteraceae bacterium]